jgi:hypothetical protein
LFRRDRSAGNSNPADNRKSESRSASANSRSSASNSSASSRTNQTSGTEGTAKPAATAQGKDSANKKADSPDTVRRDEKKQDGTIQSGKEFEARRNLQPNGNRTGGGIKGSADVNTASTENDRREPSAAATVSNPSIPSIEESKNRGKRPPSPAEREKALQEKQQRDPSSSAANASKREDALTRQKAAPSIPASPAGKNEPRRNPSSGYAGSNIARSMEVESVKNREEYRRKADAQNEEDKKR